MGQLAIEVPDLDPKRSTSTKVMIAFRLHMLSLKRNRVDSRIQKTLIETMDLAEKGEREIICSDTYLEILTSNMCIEDCAKVSSKDYQNTEGVS